MKVLIESILPFLVAHPDQINIVELVGEKTLIYELRCSNGDIGKLIGKNGKTISAIRTLLSIAANREGKRALLEVVQ